MAKIKLDLKRLPQAAQRSRKVLQRFREERREMVRRYVGRHWSDEGSQKKVPVNLISMYVSVVGKSLIPKNPRLLLSTFQRGNKPAVSAMNFWANKEIEQMKLAETLQRCVVDALFSVGFMKVGLATPAESAVYGWNLQAGQPFAERVDLDDMVFDPHARDFSEVSFIGHRFRAPLDVVRESKIYSKARKKLQASNDQMINREGDERISMLGRTYYSDQEEFDEFVDLWEIYLPRHRKIVTFEDDAGAPAFSYDNEPLREQDWVGPDSGPYKVLGYSIVPGNCMPKAPLQDLVDLDDSCNRAYRKVDEMSARTKEITAYRRQASEDANRILNANDGELVGMDNPQDINQIVFGGQAIQGVLAWATEAKRLFDSQGGNLELLGGRSPQSKTATQDKMLNENAGAGMADLQDRTIAFTADVYKALCWYWWHDPFKVMQSKYSLPGMPELSITRQVTPAMRSKGKFEDLDIQVDPYSMQHSTPQSRMTNLNQVVQNIVMPMTAQLQAQGITFDLNSYLQKVAKYMDMPDLAEIVTIAEPPQQDVESGGGEKPPMPASTNRTYTRESIPSRTEEGDTMNRVNQMFGMDTGGARNGQTVGA